VTKTKKLANLNHFLERLHLNELVAHAGILAPLLNGLGAGAPADGMFDLGLLVGTTISAAAPASAVAKTIPAPSRGRRKDTMLIAKTLL